MQIDHSVVSELVFALHMLLGDNLDNFNHIILDLQVVVVILVDENQTIIFSYPCQNHTNAFGDIILLYMKRDSIYLAM